MCLQHGYLLRRRFSNVFEMPDYQKTAVTNYLNGPASPSSLNIGPSQYNSSGSARAYPDISANGANYVIFLNGVPTTVFGTSASCPVFGAIVTLINAARLQRNLPPLGFLNPRIYANISGTLNDITCGNNGAPGGACGTSGCCGSNGFSAVAGWDPATGMGTPNLGSMIAEWTNS